MTAENFSRCLAFTLKFEGGKSDDPRDPGGRTNQGVTQRTYDHYRDVRALGRRDVYTMSVAERDEIYKIGYWDRVNGDGLRSGEDLVVWDIAVNSGPSRALQIWRAAGGGTYKIDDVIHDVCTRRLSFLKALQTWKYFGNGWGRRVAACEALAYSMAHGPEARAVIVAQAGAAKKKSDKKITQAVLAGTVAGTGAVANGGGIMWVVLAAVAVLVAVYLFQAWHHSQRADALTAAVKKMQAEQASAFAAKMAADAAAAGKQKAIEADQAALATARDAISKVKISNPE
ncbi:MAG: hypothetical protein L0Y60_13155 [Beijerinckiaceae bacterium]|nr:hypothetical protein [Beijerinckiaceae bacterium]